MATLHVAPIAQRLRPSQGALVRVGGEAALAVAAFFAYFLVRGITEGSAEAAYENGRWLVSVERSLGVGFEGAVQGMISGNQVLIDLANWIYIWGHWPFILAVALFLVFRRPIDYRLVRNAVFVAGAIGLVVFAVMPVMPPRLGVLDLTDTITTHSTSYRTLQPPALVNQYAAFPSLHVGFNLLMGIALYRATRHWSLRVVAIAMPAAMAWAVVATANHYVIDVPVGVAVALLGYAVALGFQSGTGTRRMVVRAWRAGSPPAVSGEPPAARSMLPRPRYPETDTSPPRPVRSTARSAGIPRARSRISRDV
jgi:hypothetical protein